MKMMKDRVKKIREDANLTMAEFGERIGINWRMVATLERGEREPTYTNITMICGYFSVNKEWLITGVGKPYVSNSASELTQGQRIKFVRKRLKLDQRVLAKLLDLGRATISNIERGISKMSDECIHTMCEYYKINEEWIRTGKGEMMTSDFLNTSEREKLIGELETIYPKLTTEQLKRVVKYGKTLTHYTGEFQKKKDNENDGNKKKNHVQ